MAQGAVRRALLTHGRTRSAAGAAAVEFALVSLIFFLILFGIIQYGLFFNDSLNTRQGVREAARRGVVESFDFQSGCSSGTNSAKLRCSTAKEIGAITGDAYVKVLASSSPWQRGKALVVCAMVRSDGVLGIAPMPDGGWIRSKTQMSIEQETQATTWSDSEDSLGGTGQSWSWCTA
jgi:hypothetical protein